MGIDVNLIRLSNQLCQIGLGPSVKRGKAKEKEKERKIERENAVKLAHHFAFIAMNFIRSSFILANVSSNYITHCIEHSH